MFTHIYQHQSHLGEIKGQISKLPINIQVHINSKSSSTD